jgi:hypothetical protein
LQSAHDAGHRLHGDARDVVERLLLGEVDAGRLAVEFETPRARILGAEPFARQPRPDAPAGAEFGDFLEEVRVMFPCGQASSASPLPPVRGFPALRVLSANPTSADVPADVEKGGAALLALSR